MIRENLEEKLGTAELTTSNKRILNLHIPRPTLCLRVLIRIPLSSNWITLNKADDKTANTHCEQTKNRGHDCCFEPGSRAKDPNEEDTYGDFGSVTLRKAHASVKRAQKVAVGTIWARLLGSTRRVALSASWKVTIRITFRSCSLSAF
jgi:hypothetical protein